MHELLSTRERVKILQEVLQRRVVGVEEVAEKLGLSKGLVSKTLRLLVKHGVALKQGRKFRILNNPKTRELKRFLNFIILSEKLKGLKEDWALGLGIYGSFASGENREDSDIDVWVFAKREELIKSARLKRRITELTGREVDLIVLTPSRLSKLQKEDPVFYYSLVYGSMIIWGERLDRLQSLRGARSAEKSTPVQREGLAEH
ncbi:nucleotidyltransferase domain-containing protein [Thermococcus sp. Bubb.Bath]|uniref:nucleotidyltransferase domain-containing protein n=1 Tax=Thermococcus sp. Bubb.Bath TaxID=1638242 RepID=UPI00143BDDCF|nr:nucleotidyltransferase domain-containing protein [Thermococcus sp. Bubb.Bath]NJF24984.1 nucleotidyltransferase domain-containing protein [Thermococcus sp. Bubb.Bath]